MRKIYNFEGGCSAQYNYRVEQYRDIITVFNHFYNMPIVLLEYFNLGFMAFAHRVAIT